MTNPEPALPDDVAEADDVEPDEAAAGTDFVESTVQDEEPADSAWDRGQPAPDVEPASDDADEGTGTDDA